ncbi:hypothetical protein Dvina_14335 [Dactylosporangium vinaceum]|uniref:Uncharacterized protein n=1 Tax=Dactylosporangium vinaceum TaxID=53362 RepID=A0ABV5MHU8_9ACTN|nr:hypothetical protein [Dactylosporangium vinaceum]UAB99145.1 hypothetical protein Dvina_14335 [Dactylosporangium vinaceum]
MNAEGKLRSYAAHDDVPPPRVLAEEVLATARRQVRGRRIRLAAAAGIGTALVVLGVAVALPHPGAAPLPAHPSPSGSTRAPSPTGPPLHCTAEPLPAPAGLTAAQRTARAIDPSGRYIAGTYTSGANTSGLLLWTDGKPSQPAAAKQFSAAAVNSRAVVAGKAPDADGRGQAAVFRDGKVTLLPRPVGATSSAALAINTNGDVVGRISGSTLPTNTTLAILWPAGGGYELLPTGTKDLTPESAVAIRDDGVILGTARRTGDVFSVPLPYLWNAGHTGRLLPMPRELTEEAAGATAMAGRWAIGVAGNLQSPRPSIPPDVDGMRFSTPQAYVRWNLDTGDFDELGTFSPTAVSTTGVMLGVSDMYHGTPATWRAGTVTPLPILDPSRAWLIDSGISADGTTAFGTLTPPPPPSIDDPLGPYDLVLWKC